ncbi:protease modulator HflC [uncultured Hyphomonas sp.]|jgi:membrane protease subunit HflC|uniref:protease modulator HflC n=1 Tax=uncultured Hyphomonas sp. TaxID=225298 RepID=UPI000C591F7B|nr:protease modulator HflC [Hyphomonadaceae bacterium]MBL4877751.1 protease modulator HflC [Hyphomonas sp.]|tara:strand:+ start:233319 stop:234215 length:897 start_codon:yes stop_codon:yes gene_type:complete
MRNLSWFALAIVAIVLVAILNSFYVVRQDEQALILQVGEPRAVINAPGTDEAGLYFKIPVIQTVEKLDRKNLGLDIENIQVLASDQRRLAVDAFVRWRISDPLQFYQSLRTIPGAANQLNDVTKASIREVMGDVPVPEIISGQRSELMENIREKVANELADAGISIIDVRIRQADLPREVADGVYSRMQTARKQEAERIRAEGEERARLIRAQAEREKTVLEAQAREQSEVIRGEGDARSTEIYASAYNKDVEFFRFQRALIACENSIQEGTRIIVAPDSLGLCDEFINRARANGGSR